MKRKLLVIGLDGATFRIIKPLVEKGRLPVLQGLLKSGVHGILESTQDTNSPCAWSSFITGKNPGKHGLFGFFENKPNSYEVRFLNGSFRNGKSLWKILSDQGKKVGVINVPFSYPVEEVNGFMIGGPDSPSKNDHKFCFPQGIVKEVEDEAGTYIIEAGASALVRQGKIDKAIEKLHECIQTKISCAKYLLKKNDYDFFMVVFTESDRIQHHFWKYINQFHPAYSSGEKKRFGNAIYDIYERLDHALGELIRAAGEDYSVLIMSDHGAGPASNNTFYINHWLRSEGYLRFKTNTSMQSYTRGFIDKMVRDAYIFVNSKFSRKYKRIMRNLFPGLKNKANSIVRGLQIDWENTRAFSWENAPTIYINLKEKFPAGNVESGEEYEKVREDLKQKLLHLTSPQRGEYIVEKVLKKEEVYWGPYLEKAPDLFIEWKGDQYTVRPGYANQSGHFIEVITGNQLKKVETISRASGVHKPDGIFLLSGTNINQGTEIENLHLYDVTSIILYYLNVPIPRDFDGKVLSGVFTEDFLKENAVLYSESDSESEAFDDDYSKKEAQIIEKRLQGLGYID